MMVMMVTAEADVDGRQRRRYDVKPDIGAFQHCHRGRRSPSPSGATATSTMMMAVQLGTNRYVSVSVCLCLFVFMFILTLASIHCAPRYLDHVPVHCFLFGYGVRVRVRCGVCGCFSVLSVLFYYLGLRISFLCECFFGLSFLNFFQ